MVTRVEKENIFWTLEFLIHGEKESLSFPYLSLGGVCFVMKLLDRNGMEGESNEALEESNPVNPHEAETWA
ncbi:hypothetical protein V6N12_026568 [Hibiscus sabdariffa]|uniref:Uncharacterized protein n=1 Tax=Hibiscus sabdariffa TaxID=183260 RepID=A0ABR2DTK8_9ROSI